MEPNIKSGIRISDKGVVFDPFTGESFTVNETGREILGCMVEGLTKEAIYERISSKYHLTSLEFERNYLDFITVLKSWQLLDT